MSNSLCHSLKAMEADINSQLRVAAQADFLAGINACLQKGADVNAPDHMGWTPLMWSIWSGVQAVERLIEHGADEDAVNIFGKTACDIAEAEGQHAVADYLRSRRAMRELSQERSCT